MRSNPDSTRRWLNDIRSHIELVERFLGDLDYEAFRNDSLRFYGVTRCLEIISEGSRRLPEDLRARHTSIPWKEMAGAVFLRALDDLGIQVPHCDCVRHAVLPPPTNVTAGADSTTAA